jgi:FixJ family two-component response regulator
MKVQRVSLTGQRSVSKAGIILIATGDGVLADSLRFSLELEGFEARLCDELSVFSALASAEMPGCLLLDQSVFERIVEDGNGRLLAGSAIPIVLLVEAMTKRLLGRVNEAGIAGFVEKPLLGRVLLDAIEHAISARGRVRVAGNALSAWHLPTFLRSSP